MKIIFLDVDGVLNNVNHIKKCYKKNGKMPFGMYCVPFNPKCLKNLAKLARKTNARIVVSSTWRLDKEHMAVLKARIAEYGLRVHDITDNIGMVRGKEITEWLKKNESAWIENFVVLDDEVKDINNFISDSHIVKTNADTGLTWLNYIKAKKILDNKEGILKWKKK